MPIEKLIADEVKDLFSRATQQLLVDDSKSVRTRFWLATPDHDGNVCSEIPDATSEPTREAIELDATGILIHDRVTGAPTHVSLRILLSSRL